MSFGEAFVRDAAALCCEETLEACGSEQAAVAVAGNRYRFRGMSAAQAAVLPRRFGQAAAGASPEVVVDIARAPADRFKVVELSGWDYSFDLEPQLERVLLAGWGFAARIGLRPCQHATLWTSDLGGERFEVAVANLLRVLVAYSLLEAGGALLHSAAVVDDGGAVLFVGVSGAGKSTVSRLALESGRAVLSDDLNAVVRDSGRALVEQVPFTGDLGPASTVKGRFPLARVLRLRQGSPAALRAMGKAEALALLVGCAPYLNADPLRREQLLANLEACVTGVPTDELTFPRDGGFWHLLAERKAS